MVGFVANFVRAMRREQLQALGITVWPVVDFPLSVMPLPHRVARLYLVESEPAAGAVLDKMPASVRLSFCGSIEPSNSKIEVIEGLGRVVAAGAAQDGERALKLDLPQLAAGGYRVQFRVQSEDGHVVEQDFEFTLKFP
jgi:methionine-rich copper-binding protein CopC